MTGHTIDKLTRWGLGAVVAVAAVNYMGLTWVHLWATVGFFKRVVAAFGAV